MKRTFFICATALTVAFVWAVTLCVQSLFAPQAVFSAADETQAIAIDAGHGGIDGGVCGVQTGVKESDLNLEIALLLKEQLQELGFKVLLTRKTKDGLYDTTAKGFKRRDMQKRKEILQQENPSMVISLHQNFYPTKSARGAQVFYSAKNEQSKILAFSLQEKLNALYASEGVKGRNCVFGELFMLECLPVPSVLVECGFLSSEKDENLLVQTWWQKRLCQSIVSGVLAYFSQSSC